jgi:DNA-binding response OmpR family regulator
MPPPHRPWLNHICIVDEDEHFRALLRGILQQRGYTVLEAHDGQRALTLMGTSPYRLVVVLTQALSEQDSLTVFSAALADRCLARFHAFLLLSVAPHLSPALETLVSTLKVTVITHPENLQSVLKRINLLAQGLEKRRKRRARRTLAKGIPALRC